MLQSSAVYILGSHEGSFKLLFARRPIADVLGKLRFQHLLHASYDSIELSSNIDALKHFLAEEEALR